MCPATYARTHRQRTPRRLPALFATLFLHFVPSIFFGIIALFLDEVICLINRVATLCHGPSPPSSRSSSSRKLIRQSSNPPSVCFDDAIQSMVFDHQLESQSPLEPRSLIEPNSSREPHSANDFLLPVTEASLACLQQFAKSKSTPPSQWSNSSEFEPNCKTPIISNIGFVPEPRSNHLDTETFIYNNASTFVSSVTTHSSTSSIPSKPTSFVKPNFSKATPTAEVEPDSYSQRNAQSPHRDYLSRHDSFDLYNLHEAPNHSNEIIVPLPSREKATTECCCPLQDGAKTSIKLSPPPSHITYKSNKNASTPSNIQDRNKLIMEMGEVITSEIPVDKNRMGIQPHPDDNESTQPTSRKLPGKLVEKRVNAFENVIAEGDENTNSLKVLMPSTPLLSPVDTERLRPKPDFNPPSLQRGSTTLFSERGGYSSDDELETRAELKKRTPNSGEVDELVGISADMKLTDNDPAEDDAPTGVESLKELIPPVFPPHGKPEKNNTPNVEAQPEILRKTPRQASEHNALSLDDCIAEVDSMEQIPSLKLQKRRSNVSTHTESYSSPDSPSTSVSGQIRPVTTWMKHEDLFAEEPSTHFDGDLEDKSSLRLDEFSIPSLSAHSNAGMSESIDSLRNNAKNSNILYQKQTNWSHSLERLSHQQESRDHLFPPLYNEAGSERWSAPVQMFDQSHPKRWLGRSGKEKRGIPEDLLFRQASIDVTSLPSTHRHKQDRQRGIAYNGGTSGGDRNSRDAVPLFGALPSRIPVMPKSGRPSPSQRAGRSTSASASRYENWPEYMPSNADEASRLGRRHASDMSFGATARKADMLPPELLGKNNDSGYPQIDNLPERFGGRGWRRRRFGLGHRDSIEVRFVVKNLLRRRRKANLDEGESIINQEKDDGQVKWPGAEKDLRFESELDQDTVFSLLNRICPECGFRITIRRGNFKIKMEVPRGGDLEPLLVSVVLIRISHGRNTLVCLSRSKEDVSGGPIKDIYSAATLLRNRLESHVEFIEDSFASLYLEGGGTATPDTESHLGRNV